jgi:hypothetical protein
MKLTTCMLLASIFITGCASGPSPIVTLNAFDNTDNGTGTMDNNGVITITTKDKIYKGTASAVDEKKPMVKNNPAVKYKRGTGNGTAQLKSDNDSLNCEFNQDDDSAMGYCKDSAGKEYDLYAK